MKQQSTPFQSQYTDNSETVYNIQGTVKTIPANTPNTSFPVDEDFISVSFSRTRVGQEPGKPDSHYYIRKTLGEWQVGNFVNNKWESGNTHFTQWLKTFIVETFETADVEG